jgi:hypothetical protein
MGFEIQKSNLTKCNQQYICVLQNHDISDSYIINVKFCTWIIVYKKYEVICNLVKLKLSDYKF